MTENKELATMQMRGVLIHRFAEKFGVDDRQVFNILAKTCFKVSNPTGPTPEQMASLLIVAEQYNLNPFLKEIHAFENKGAIVPIVGVDGWTKIRVGNEKFDGMDLSYSDKMLIIQGSKPCPEWCESTIYLKGCIKPVVVREYFDECFRPTEPWKMMPKRMLRHKASIQVTRLAFGYGGLHDEDEGRDILENATQIIDAHAEQPAPPLCLEEKVEAKAKALAAPVETAPTPAEVAAAAKAEEKQKTDQYRRGPGRPSKNETQKQPNLPGRPPTDDTEDWPPVNDR